MHVVLSQYELTQRLTEDTFVGAFSDGQIEVPLWLILRQDKTIQIVLTNRLLKIVHNRGANETFYFNSYLASLFLGRDRLLCPEVNIEVTTPYCQGQRIMRDRPTVLDKRVFHDIMVDILLWHSVASSP